MRRMLGRIIGILAKLTAILLLINLLAACGNADDGEPTKPVHVVVLIGSHSNARQIIFNESNSLYEYLLAAGETAGRVTLMSVSGSPDVQYDFKIPAMVENIDPAKAREVASGYANQIMASAATVAASHPEADYLRAIQIGSLYLQEDSESERYLIVDGTMISTTGTLPISQDLLNSDPEKIVRRLAEIKEIVDLSGTNVIVSFLGQTGGAQGTMPQFYISKLEALWTEYFKACHAKSVTFRKDNASTASYEGYPEVSVVYFDSSVVEAEPVDNWMLTSEELLFLENTDVFADEGKAIAKLSEVADSILSHPGHSFYIVGLTAGEDNDFTQQLSEMRAKRVKEILVDLGVDDAVLTIVGLGSGSYWHKNDIGSDGRTIEEIARGNRAVLIIDRISEEAAYVY